MPNREPIIYDHVIHIASPEIGSFSTVAPVAFKMQPTPLKALAQPAFVQD